MTSLIGIGVDIEQVSRFVRVLSDEALRKKMFTQNEIAYCLAQGAPQQHFAVRFAAKEAVFKALSSRPEFHRLSHGYIEIEHAEYGAPCVSLLSPFGSDNLRIELSLSHSGEYVVAMVLAQKEDVAIVETSL